MKRYVLVIMSVVGFSHEVSLMASNILYGHAWSSKQVCEKTAQLVAQYQQLLKVLSSHVVTLPMELLKLIGAYCYEDTRGMMVPMIVSHADVLQPFVCCHVENSELHASLFGCIEKAKHCDQRDYSLEDPTLKYFWPGDSQLLENGLLKICPLFSYGSSLSSGKWGVSTFKYIKILFEMKVDFVAKTSPEALRGQYASHYYPISLSICEFIQHLDKRFKALATQYHISSEKYRTRYMTCTKQKFQDFLRKQNSDSVPLFYDDKYASLAEAMAAIAQVQENPTTTFCLRVPFCSKMTFVH